MISLAVFGAGRIGAVHATNASALPGVRVRYLVDPVAGALRDDLAARLSAEAAEPGEVFADAGVDGIVIASSTDTHADLLQQAVDAGKPVFCEKPRLRHRGAGRGAGCLMRAFRACWASSVATTLTSARCATASRAAPNARQQTRPELFP